MDSVVPTAKEMKRQEKLLRSTRLAENSELSPDPPSPKQQKKINKAMLRIIKDTVGDYSPVQH